MQFIAIMGAVECPCCGTSLQVIDEQDARVARLRHSAEKACDLFGNTYRVDRKTGYGELINEA